MTTDSTRSALLDTLVSGYDDFKRRLTTRLGSAELASDALQDTFLRLASIRILGMVQSPRAYVLRTAFNIAINRLVAEKRRGNAVELDLVEIADEAPDSTRILESRSDVEALKRALRDLPPRRRDIVIAVALNETPIPVLAQHYNVTIRTIQIEFKRGLQHCAQRLERRSQDILPRRQQQPSPLHFEADEFAVMTERDPSTCE